MKRKIGLWLYAIGYHLCRYGAHLRGIPWEELMQTWNQANLNFLREIERKAEQGRDGG